MYIYIHIHMYIYIHIYLRIYSNIYTQAEEASKQQIEDLRNHTQELTDDIALVKIKATSAASTMSQLQSALEKVGCTYIYIYIYVHIHISTHIIYICIYIYIYIYIYVYNIHHRHSPCHDIVLVKIEATSGALTMSQLQSALTKVCYVYISTYIYIYTHIHIHT